jgi:hypothetical protein
MNTNLSTHKLDLDRSRLYLASTMLGPHHDGAIPGLYEALLSRTSSDILRSLSLMDSVDDFTAAALDHLNGLLPHRQIAWIGRFGDLATGGGPFERMVRSAYLVETGELDENVDPFGSAPDFVDAVDLADWGERDRFVEYLRGFGS